MIHCLKNPVNPVNKYSDKIFRTCQDLLVFCQQTFRAGRLKAGQGHIYEIEKNKCNHENQDARHFVEEALSDLGAVFLSQNGGYYQSDDVDHDRDGNGGQKEDPFGNDR